MAVFSKLVITQNGQALMAKMIAGTGNIEFTKICASSTQYTESQLSALTALSNVKQTSLVSKVTRTNEVAIKVEGAYTNADLKTGYYMRTLGLYAVDPDKGEILYAVAIETSGNCYMPPYNGVTVTAAYIQLYTTVGNADNVSLEVNPGAYATIGDIQALEAEIADLKAFVGYTDDDIYGVEVDFKNKKFTRLAGAVNRTPGEGFDSIQAFGGRRRCNVTNDGTVIAYQGDAAFTTTGKLTMAVDLNPEGTEKPDASLQFAVGTIVQTMVEQPRFYYKVVPLQIEKTAKGGITRKVRYYVSDTPKAGFKLHPAFIRNGEPLTEYYEGAFEGCLYDYSASAYILDDAQVAAFTAAVGAGDMLSSIANAKPISGTTQNLTRPGTRILAQNRGEGWEQEIVQTACATALLMLIEYATFNIQSAIGAGNVYKAWLEDGINYAENTGATVILGNASGAVTNDNDIMIVSYRGKENPWGNIWGWVDGINSYCDIEAGTDTIYIADHDFTDNTGTAPYEEVNISPSMVNGYVSAFCYDEDFDWLFIAGEVKGSSALPVGDYFYQSVSTGWRVAMLGGRWDGSLSAGPFSWALYAASSHRARDVGGRLVFRKKKAA